ncbi:MAG: 16S rRNA (cytosine(967)-C(5))-methyltransferase RsmB [Lachnospiraceae bacterium]|nr:16S rRNA (cytosine(967)-C(5))-methyltransferase RsmB [Lachnospiraceae bacterium]
MEILEKQQYSHLVMQGVLNKYSYLEKQERSFIKRVCEGTVEQKIRIDYVIDQFSKTKTKKMKPLIRTLLRMGTYQILFMDGVPDAAVCNESVKLAGKRGFGTLKGFVNGVLRNISRNKDNISYPDRESDETSYFKVMYSMPEEIIALMKEQYSAAETEMMLESLLGKRPLTIRISGALSEEEKKELLEHFAEDGIVVAETELPYVFSLEKVDKISELYGYEEGKFFVQDIGSAMVVEMAGIKKDDYVIDVCAAPGGKATHAAEKLCGSGRVQARDLTEYKVSMIEENVERLRLANMDAMVWDATVTDESAIGKADVVIADLPCSGLGVIGRKSDIKYRITQQSLEEVEALQRDILSVVHNYVKPGGVLMYSTCTINRKENEGNKEWFLQNFPFEEEQERLMLPGRDGSDGFYMVRLRRKV